MSRLCPCNSGIVFDKCCLPFLRGVRMPETAEALMRSRFTAYSEGRADYIVQTTVEPMRRGLDQDAIRQQCKNFRYLNLKIIKTELGGKGDEAGTVLFHASLQMGKRRILHRELSSFVKEDGRWLYVDGETNE